MVAEQERQSQKTPFERLQEAYNQVSDTYKRLKPEIDRAREQALKPAIEALDEIWQKAQTCRGDVEAFFLVPGGRGLRIKNVQASDLHNLEFREFPINILIGENETSLFRPEDKIEIDVTNNSRIMITSPQAEKMLIVDFLSEVINFGIISREKLEGELTTEETKAYLGLLLPKALLEKFSTESDDLKKALAVNELVQAIYQIGDNKLKAPVNS